MTPLVALYPHLVGLLDLSNNSSQLPLLFVLEVPSKKFVICSLLIDIICQIMGRYVAFLTLQQFFLLFKVKQIFVAFLE